MKVPACARARPLLPSRKCPSQASRERESPLPATGRSPSPALPCTHSWPLHLSSITARTCPPPSASKAAAAPAAAAKVPSSKKASASADDASADLELAKQLVAALHENPGHSILLVPQEFMFVAAPLPLSSLLLSLTQHLPPPPHPQRGH